jgi:hypothetical protein
MQNNLKGFAQHSYLAIIEAVLHGVDIVVIGTDADTKAKSVGAKVCQNKREALRRGYQKALADRPSASPAPALVRIVPLPKLEAWLLADEKAFRKATQRIRGTLPKPAEELRGQNDAKLILQRLGGAGSKVELARSVSGKRERPSTFT